MSVIKKATIVVVSALSAAMFLAAPASAGPAVDACSLAGVPFCGFLPVVSDIDRAIDTGLQPGELTGPLELGDDAQLAELCGNFCS